VIRPLLATAALLCLAGLAIADSAIDANVVSVAGNSIYLDAGRDAGVTAGARVVFRLAGGELVEATVIDVTAGNARAELKPGSAMPSPGDRASVDALDAAVESAAASTPASPAPHAPWRAQLPTDPNAPLLAPAFGTRPEDRPATFHGRLYSTYRFIDDRHSDRTYSYGRSGLWLEGRNLLGDGGRLRFQGEGEYRSASSVHSDNEGLDASILRLSYAWGLDRDAPFRGEVGRFVSAYLPELGIFDGAEAVIRFEGGLSLGAGAGAYPLDTEELPNAGDDLGFHVFADYLDEDSPRVLQATLGYQQTFHAGAADRSLVIGRILANPSDSVRLFGMAMVDLYDSTDTLESNAAEVTQAVAQASFRFTPTSGGILSYTRTAWPELDRDEYEYFPPWLVTDGFVDRMSGSWWTKLDQHWRFSARGNWWRDQSREGYGGELALDWTLPVERPSSLMASVYFDDAAYVSGAGVRVQGQMQFGDFHCFLGYDGFLYTTESEFVDSSERLSNRIRGDVAWQRGAWLLDVEASYVFGDDEDAVTLGVTAQYRF